MILGNDLRIDFGNDLEKDQISTLDSKLMNGIQNSTITKNTKKPQTHGVWTRLLQKVHTKLCRYLTAIDGAYYSSPKGVHMFRKLFRIILQINQLNVREFCLT